MRRSGPWQSVWDDRILEIASNDEDGIVSVGELADHENIRVSKTQVSRRCSKLAEHHLFRKVGHGVYKITDEGVAYLSGEYDADAGVYLDDNNFSSGEPTETANGNST